MWAAIRKEVPTHKDVDVDFLAQAAPAPHAALGAGWQGDPAPGSVRVAGPGGQYPKGFRSGAPFQTGQNWPLSWELRSFEARQRPGVIPASSSNGAGPEESDAQGVAESPTVATAGSELASNNGDFVLYTGRLIYDQGSMISATAALHGIASKGFLEMSPEDAHRLGIEDGDDVVVSTDGFEAALPVLIGDIAAGAVFVPFDQPGFRANRLIRGLNPKVKVVKS